MLSGIQIIIVLADEAKQSIHTDLYHLNVDTNAEPFRCGLCCAKFKQVILLDKHSRDEEHQVILGKLKCWGRGEAHLTPDNGQSGFE